MEGTDVCFAPVLSLAEAPLHPHNAARGTFVDVGGMTQPAPAPRYSETRTDTPTPTPRSGADTAAILGELGYSDAEIAALAGAKAIAT
jgi:alpha-methylacyl-CoA racemase